MSMKIKISYTDDKEAEMILRLLLPIKERFRVKKSTGTPPYNHLFFNPKKPENIDK